ncbi:hypothetical protein M2324_003608 [Rhodovulum sulfidophilum]|uniref:hypothetical protein n=1 Tax=Rhodovulum sulfidophilum TaxID=35806 RepID=UPI0012DABDDE|nr:hypothetical protein [Rhodovulum sulfidophilum]MCW2305189.1 hypothetical protein [Rhodovulum sulfidophilum]
MAQKGVGRALSAIAMARLSERDIRSLHDLVSDTDPTTFIDIIRDIEDEVENSISLILESSRERSSYDVNSEGLYRELDRIRKGELRLTVQQFVDALTESISQNGAREPSQVPSFDSRRGLQVWLKRMSERFSESEIYHAAMKIRHERYEGKGSDWKLR